MRTPRRLVGLTAVTLVALPGLALAQDDAPVDPPPAEGEAQAEEAEVEDADEDDPVLLALATCLPSGRELHGTGLTKGRVMSQAARDGAVVLGDAAPLPVTEVGQVDAVCDAVQSLADEATVPDRAKGRPDWAGPKDQEGPKDKAARGDRPGRGGPPPWAGTGRGDPAEG